MSKKVVVQLPFYQNKFTDKIVAMMPPKYSQLGNDGLLAFVENFVKDHFLPTMFVDYRKGVQQAISSSAAFHPRENPFTSYTTSVSKVQPVLQGILTIDFLTKEVLGWAQAMPKFFGDLVKYVQTFLETTYERCRTSYTEAVLEKQTYMLIGRLDIENLMRRDPANAFLPTSLAHANGDISSHFTDGESEGVDLEINALLMKLMSIKHESFIRDKNKLILLASLSDSSGYIADSIEIQVLITLLLYQYITHVIDRF